MDRKARDYTDLTIVEAIRQMVELKTSQKQRSMNRIEGWFLLRAAELLEEAGLDERI